MPDDITKSIQKKKIELNAILEWVVDGQSVLDLGCGRGILLEELKRRRNAYTVGVDMDFEKITHCIKRGVNAYHGDIMDILKSFDNASFDWIICSRTLPELENALEVVLESLRVANRVAVGFINYAYWQNRLSILFNGSRITNEVYPEPWESSRPTNQISVNSFKEFCKQNDIIIHRRHFLRADWRTPCTFLPNLRAGYAIFEISKKGTK